MEYRNKLKELGINIERSGKTLCPKCSADRKDKTDPCLSVTFKEDRVAYKCHNCDDFSGAVFYRDNNKRYAAKVYSKPQKPQVNESKDNLYNYFEKRKISKKTLDRCKIEINNKREILFLYYKDNELINIKYRFNKEDGRKKFRQTPGTKKTFFCMDLVPKEATEVIICEGEIDFLSLIEIGILNVVAIPQGAKDGAKLNDSEYITNCWDFLQRFETYIIAPHNDHDGDILKEILLSRLGRHKCKIVDFKQYNDINEVLMKGNADVLKEYIDNAKFVEIDGIVDFYSHLGEIVEFHENGYKKGYLTWSDLDNIFTIKFGYLMIVTGIPGRGKSLFVDNLLFILSSRYGLKHLIASSEDTLANHFASLSNMFSGIKFGKQYGFTEKQMMDSLEFIDDHFFRFNNNKQWSVPEIIELTEYAVRRYGIKTLTIDPYSKLDNKSDGKETDYIADMLAKLTILAKKLNILIIFVAHPTKLRYDRSGRAIVPTMQDISGSVHWHNAADYGLTINREMDEATGIYEDEMVIYVHKVKNISIGNPSGGKVRLEYNPKTFKLQDGKKGYFNN